MSILARLFKRLRDMFVKEKVALGDQMIVILKREVKSESTKGTVGD